MLHRFFGINVVRTGAARTVILTRKHAIKLPRCDTWRTFLKGLLANDQERVFWQMRHPMMCPVLFCFPGGLFVVMPRAETLSYEEWFAFYDQADGMECVPVERKLDSWGKLDGSIVAVDYGN